MKLKIIFFVLLIYLLFNLKSGIAQIPNYSLFAKNFLPTLPVYYANQFTFDIVIQHNDNTDFEYAGGKFIINFYPGVANGGSLTYSFAGPDSSDLPIHLRPRNPIVNLETHSNSQLILGVNEFPGAGNGFIIPQGLPGVKIIKMRLRTTASNFYIETGGPIGVFIALYPVWNNNTRIFSYIGKDPMNITQSSNHFIDDLGLTPVELSSFTATLNKNNVSLNWSTVSEINNSGFDIERSIVSPYSNEPGEWSKIISIKGNGTTSNPTNYGFIDRNLKSGKYKYKLKQIDYNGNYEFFYLLNEVDVGIPSKYTLSQNYPNPFNPFTNINYQLPVISNVHLRVYDIKGAEIITLIDERQDGGYYTTQFNSFGVSSGIYYYTLTANSFIETKKMLLIK